MVDLANTELRAAISGMLNRLELDQSGTTFYGKRDIYRALGYRPTLKPADYWDRYRRGGIAKRIVETFPKSTWRGGAELIETEDAESSTKFEKACVELNDRLHLWQTFQKADILAGLGHYSLIVLGGPGKFEDPLDKCPPNQLKYLATFSERDITIEQLVNDPQNERFGLPDYYTINYSQGTGMVSTTRTMNLTGRIHWSRVVHVVEGALDHPLFGPPRLEAVWNYLDDLMKCVGGGSEAFWKRVDGGKQIKLDPTLPMPSVEQKAELHQQLEEYTHELRRVLTTRGVDIQDLGTNVSTFAPQVSSIMDLIASTTGIPQRILMGSERGELASTTDQSNYDDRIEDRRHDFAEPSVVRPFIDRLIDLGTLPEPKEYYVRWPEIKNMNDSQRMAMALQAATLNQTSGESIILPAEIRDKILGFEPLTPEQIQEEQDKKAQAVEDAQAAMQGGPAPKKKKQGKKTDEAALQALEAALTDALVNENQDLAESILSGALRVAGDFVGHPFHGNQWTKAFEQLHTHGGFTYHPVTDTFPSTGFSVSAHKELERVIPADKITALDVTQFIADNEELLAQSGNYLGGWHNTKDGNVYLDVSTVVETRQAAEALAREHDQIAFYDLANNEEIETPHG